MLHILTAMLIATSAPLTRQECGERLNALSTLAEYTARDDYAGAIAFAALSAQDLEQCAASATSPEDQTERRVAGVLYSKAGDLLLKTASASPYPHPQAAARSYYVQSNALFQRLIAQRVADTANLRIQIAINTDKIEEIDHPPIHD